MDCQFKMVSTANWPLKTQKRLQRSQFYKYLCAQTTLYLTKTSICQTFGLLCSGLLSFHNSRRKKQFIRQPVKERFPVDRMVHRLEQPFSRPTAGSESDLCAVVEIQFSFFLSIVSEWIIQSLFTNYKSSKHSDTKLVFSKPMNQKKIQISLKPRVHQQHIPTRSGNTNSF